MFAANRKPNGQDKDTFLNIQPPASSVNLADELAKAMHESSGDFPPRSASPTISGLNRALEQNRRARLADTPGRWSASWKMIDVNDDRR